MVMASGGGGGLVQSPPDMLHHHIMDTSSHVEMMPSESTTYNTIKTVFYKPTHVLHNYFIAYYLYIPDKVNL